MKWSLIKPSDKEIEISIIIPTYNKFPQNLLTLYSIENQNFDLTKIEVIMVDDGSTDQTMKLKAHKFPFYFKLLSNDRNLGRPAARNLGLKVARGKIIIFLDAEIIVRPDFLTIHHHYHSKHPNMVVTGVMSIRKLYSVLFPDFSLIQIQECKDLIKNLPEFRKKCEIFEKEQYKVPLIDKQHILSGDYTRLSMVTAYEQFYKRTIIANYGFELKGYRIPWQMFGTGNVSVSKLAIDQVGLFAEYPGYGWDDLEMGYRLFKNGAFFVSDRRLISYHQEHPIGKKIRDESKENYYRFQETYLDVDQMIISLTFLPKPYNLHKTNEVLVNYHKLCTQYPNGFPLMKKLFHQMLRQIGFFYSQKITITNLMSEPLDREILTNEKFKLSKLKQFQPFLECFERLEKL